MQVPDAAIGAIVAAVVAGVISLLGLVISKESKISEFGQAWIDALRADVAALISSVHAIADGSSVHEESWGYNNPIEVWKASREDWNNANRSITAIRLRVNPEKSRELLDLVRAFEDEIQPRHSTSRERLRELHGQLLDRAQKLLRREWQDVKLGEPVYRLAKGITLAIVLTGLFALAVIAVSKS